MKKFGRYSLIIMILGAAMGCSEDTVTVPADKGETEKDVNNIRFAAPRVFGTGEHPRDAVASDFDGDGDWDLASVNRNSHDISIISSNGIGSFSFPITYFTGQYPNTVTTGDFNGDGRVDLAIAGDGISVLINTTE
ncbi:MAG: VCBS repeat-containing protein [Candidatus Krumholzibacteriales bacterium]